MRRKPTIGEMRKRYNKLMCEIGADHLVSDNPDWDEWDKMISEVEYWLDMLYCEGTNYYDLKSEAPRVWLSLEGKFKRFIKRFGDKELVEV